MASDLRIQLFGSPKVFAGEDPLPPFLTHKSRELFAYLAAHPNRDHPRILLAGLLWPDTTDEKARASFSTELWRLKRVLGNFQDCLVLSRDEACLAIDPQWVDIHTFREFTQKQDYPSMKRAVDLYAGEFMEGCYADWCIFERERLRDLFLKTLENLLVYHETRGEWLDALAYAKRLLGYDPLREELHRSLMKLYVRIGDRPAALAQYRMCAESLEKELGITPMPETRLLFEQIRSTARLEAFWSTRLDAARDLTVRKISELKRSRQYLPEVFTKRPALDGWAGEFARSPSAGLILIAPSGYGKTTWLAHLAEERIEAGDLVLFYEAGSLTLNFERDLARRIWGSDAVTAPEALLALGREARQNDKIVWLLVDGLNSFRDLGASPADLLRRLDQFISHPELQDAVQTGRCSLKVVVTCRDYTWKRIAEGGSANLNWGGYFRNQPLPVERFDDDELQQALWNYLDYFNVRDAAPGLTEEARRLYRHPLLLRLASEIWQGRFVSAAASETLILREYFAKAIPQTSARQFSITLAAWMLEHRRTEARLSDLHGFLFQGAEGDGAPLRQLLDAGVLIPARRGLDETIRFAHDRLLEYLFAEYLLARMEKGDDGASLFMEYDRQLGDFSPGRESLIMALLLKRDEELFLPLADAPIAALRELCLDGLLALAAEDQPLALSIAKRIMALDSVEAKRIALRAVPGMGAAGYEIFYSAIGAPSEVVRRIALISFDQLWRRDFHLAVGVMKRLIEEITPQTVWIAPRRIQTLLRIVGWFSNYGMTPEVFDEIENAAYALAAEKLKLPTSEDQSHIWTLVKWILARNTISWPSNEEGIYEIVQPGSLDENEQNAFRRILGSLRIREDGLDGLSSHDVWALLKSKVDAAHYPAHHQLVLWMHHRPLDAARSIASLFDESDDLARLWLLMAFLPSSMPPPVPFPQEALHLLEGLSARFAEENEPTFLHGAERGVLALLGGIAFLPLGVRYLRAGETGFPLLSSLLTLSKVQPEKFALLVRLLAPLGWSHPREVLDFLAGFVEFKPPPHPRILETLGSVSVFHGGLVDGFLRRHGADEDTLHRIKHSVDLEQVTHRARLISTHDVRVTSIILGAPYGVWLTDCVMSGYLDAKSPGEAALRFGDGLFETLRQCDWRLKRLFKIPD
jgi:DNA-binding SARP family transcriptional activator